MLAFKSFQERQQLKIKVKSKYYVIFYCLLIFSMTTFMHWGDKQRNQNNYQLIVVEEIKQLKKNKL